MLFAYEPVAEQLIRIRRILYGLPFPDVTPEDLIERYTRHNQEVMDYFQDRPQSLLVVDWENGDGWQELCGFLGREIPREPFPHANKGHYARQNKESGRDTLAGFGVRRAAAGAGARTESGVLLETYLEQLQLPTFVRNYARFAEEAAQKGLGYDRFLLALAEQEVLAREGELGQPQTGVRAAARPAGGGL
jgi:hypothetical protein